MVMTEKQKLAVKAYREKNREKVNAYERLRQKEMRDSNPEFREKQKIYQANYRASKKLETTELANSKTGETNRKTD